MSTSHQTVADIAVPGEDEDQHRPAHALHVVDSGPAEAKAVPTEPSAGRSKAYASPSYRVRWLLVPLTAIGVVLALVGRWNAWQGSAAVQETNNAMVRAEVTRLSARVSGNVRRVGIRDFQSVKAGDLLLEVDPEDYQAAVAQAEANAAAAKVGQAASAYHTARATLTASEATIEAQRRQLDVLNGQRSVLAANLSAAELRLGDIRIIAPFDGERHVQEGDYVNIGTQLIAVAPLPAVYVTANCKETQLTHVAPGQPVEIT